MTDNATEIEITAKMIEAGVNAYFGLSCRDWEDKHACISEIIRAALAAMPHGSP